MAYHAQRAGDALPHRPRRGGDAGGLHASRCRGAAATGTAASGPSPAPSPSAGGSGGSTSRGILARSGASYGAFGRPFPDVSGLRDE